MKLTIFTTALVATTNALVLPARHTLNELCFHISARSAPWTVDAEEIPLGRDFTYGNFCFDNRFKTLRNANHQQCSMEAPDYRLECHDNLNGTTKFEISYPAADGPPYLTYDTAPGIFYACPADSEKDYTFDIFSASAPFGSVCMPVTLTLEPSEASCSGDDAPFSNTTSSTSTTTNTFVASTIQDETTTSPLGRSITRTPAPTTTSLHVGDNDDDEVELTTEGYSTTSVATLTSSQRRPVPTTFSSFTGSSNYTFSVRLNSTASPSRTISTNVTAVPPLSFVPTTPTPAETLSDTTPVLTQRCRVPISAPSIAPWRITSSNPGSNPTFGNAAEVAITDNNSTVLEYVIPDNFGMPAMVGSTTSVPDDKITGNGVCALQFRMPFCSDLAPGYPCYGFSGTTQEVRNDAGMLLELLHNGGDITWDNKALHQVFPGKNTILGTFDCADIGGGEVGDRTMSWLASSTRGFELEYLQAGVGDDADFTNGVGAWIVACQ